MTRRSARFAHHNRTNTSSHRSATARKTKVDQEPCPLVAGLHPSHTYFRSARPTFPSLCITNQLSGAAASVPRSMAPR